LGNVTSSLATGKDDDADKDRESTLPDKVASPLQSKLQPPLTLPVPELPGVPLEGDLLNSTFSEENGSLKAVVRRVTFGPTTLHTIHTDKALTL